MIKFEIYYIFVKFYFDLRDHGEPDYKLVRIPIIKIKMSTLCPNITDDPNAVIMLSETEQGLAITLYGLVAVLAVGGNAIVLYIVIKFQRMRTPTNLFICNLAVADILMASFCVPFSYWNTLVLQYWLFGAVMCTAIHFCQCLSVLLSSHTLMVISLDRFV